MTNKNKTNKWVQIRNHLNNGKKPAVSIHQSHLQINAESVDKYGLEKKKSATIFHTEDHMQCMVKFHDDEPEHSFKITASASHSKNCLSRRISCKALIEKNPRLKKASYMSREDRNIPLFKDDDDNIIFNCAPCFEHLISIDEIRLIDIDQIGIYRCLDDDKDVLYIGSGEIRNRVLSAQKKIEELSFIEFSIVHDRQEAFYWESHYLDAYIEKHGRKPYYNKILAPKSNFSLSEVVDV